MRWHSYSGRDQKVGFAGIQANTQLPNWFDPCESVFITGIDAEKIRQAYSELYSDPNFADPNYSDPNLPTFTKMAPEIVITISDGNEPLGAKPVVLIPQSGVPAKVEGVITDVNGTAWFAPVVPGDYAVRWYNGSGWNTDVITVSDANFDSSPGYHNIEWFDLGDVNLSSSIWNKLDQPVEVTSKESGANVSDFNQPYVWDGNTALLIHMNIGLGQYAYNYASGIDHGGLGLSTYNGIYDPNWAIGQSGFGNCLNFDSTKTDVLSVPNYDAISSDLTDDFTLEAWVNISSLSADMSMFNRGVHFKMYIKSDGEVSVLVNGANEFNHVWITTTTPFDGNDIGNWNHVAFTIDASDANNAGTNQDAGKIYVNGVAQGTSYSAGGGGPGDEPLGIGSGSSDYLGVGGSVSVPPQKPFDGMIDEARISTVIR